MPIYGYLCKVCGPFEEFCSMADFVKPMPCPSCGEPALRQVAAAKLNRMSGSNRKAHSLNEKNSNEPRIVRGKDCDHSHHGPNHHGHSHPHGYQHAVADRPWMVGH